SHVGKIYVDRNVMGAVVGVQPFGGHGLSGTGPKAGGPLYLQRLVQPRPASPFPVDAEVVSPGPVGEHNLYRTGPAGHVISFAQDGAASAAQIEAATANGNTAVIADSALSPSSPSASAERVSSPADWRQAGPFARASVHGEGAFVAAVQKALATSPGPIVTAETPCAAGGYARAMSVGEQSVSINTTAAGGNASSMASA
ncbi:hypothetical protein OY671_008191, partial [Metschnikowia pulcherrima]